MKVNKYLPLEDPCFSRKQVVNSTSTMTVHNPQVQSDPMTVRNISLCQDRGTKWERICQQRSQVTKSDQSQFHRGHETHPQQVCDTEWPSRRWTSNNTWHTAVILVAMCTNRTALNQNNKKYLGACTPHMPAKERQLSESLTWLSTNMRVYGKWALELSTNMRYKFVSVQRCKLHLDWFPQHQ